MDLRQMKYFLALAQELNFGRAAQRLHMAQPPLTRQIRGLEEELGTPLFLRTPKGVELTAAGQALLDEVPNILSLAERASERTRLAGEGLIGRLDVGIFGSGVLDVIPRLLADFHRERPAVRLELHNMTKAEQLQALRERRITVGFNRLVQAEPGLGVEIVLREPLVVGLPETHPLCERAQIDLRDLSGVPMILYPNAPLPGLAQEVTAAFVREGARLEVAQEVEDVLTCVALVASGFGCCITTQSAMSLRLPGVAYRPLRSRYLRDIALCCLYRTEDSSPVLTAFLQVVRSFAARQSNGGT
ncbi:LysR substrate-binding domain-containing protein [Acidovorax sp. D2M1]|uniref:LysR substrate-binding domain-containing protein n=1 Tax=Acidovorax benzenivorans TaxID=2987520 RepID=A0ABT5S018_9BURK|nr:LysR substrate-binding domain-containing protein [Acidovorax benzenivorans]MDD2179293.1 LysR substrate-binding domain-containing protein [Acidovorax benzenivorans]